MSRKRYFEELSIERNPVGKLSPQLRKALNLEDDMLPFWIYRMRILGYPPSWMKEAQMSTTTLSIIDTNENGTNKLSTFGSNKNSEEGEIDDTMHYFKDSLIEFPGFNVPVPSDVKDDWLILGMPPYQEKQRLSEAVKSMKLFEPVPYKKTKLDSSENSFQAESSEQAKGECLESPESPPAAECSVGLQESDKGESNEETPKEGNGEEESHLDRKMKVVSYGTPVPKSVKPNLPSLDKFAVGMGELLYFQNLPNSTGAYKDKIKGVLQKVRNRFNKDDNEQ